MKADEFLEIASLSQRIRKTVVLACCRRRNTYSLPALIPEIYENESVVDYEQRLQPLLKPHHHAIDPKPRATPNDVPAGVLDKIKELFKWGLGFQ